MRVVQISDLHIDKKRFTSTNRLPLDQLISDLKEWNQRKKIDYVLITGDIAHIGGITFGKEKNYYDIIEEKVIKPIYKGIELGRHQVFVIPGNHDVDRDKIDPDTFMGLMGRLHTKQTINDHVRQFKTRPKAGMRGLDAFARYQKKRYQGFKDCQVTNFEAAFVVNYLNVKIGIAGFNSAWGCLKESENDLIPFGTQQILDAGDFFKKRKTPTAFNIGMIHHPLRLLKEDEAPEAERFLKDNGFGLLLCGHKHKDETSKAQQHGTELLVSMARSAFNDNDEEKDEFKSGYKIIDFGYSVDSYIEVIINYRKYAKTGKYDYDTDSGERAGAETFQLKVTSRSRPFYEVLKKNSISLAQAMSKLTKEREEVFKELSGKTKILLESSFPYISDQILDTINKKILSFQGFDHFRKDMRLDYVIKSGIRNHFVLEESQSFRIISDGNPVDYKVNAHVEVEAGRGDKSSMVLNDLSIDGVDYTKKVKTTQTVLQGKGRGRTTSISISFLKKLKGAKQYVVKRKQTSTHCLNSNGIWKTDIGVIMDGITVNIRNEGPYKVDLEPFGNNLSFKYENGTFGTMGKGESVEGTCKNILMPGDGFVILVNPT